MTTYLFFAKVEKFLENRNIFSLGSLKLLNYVHTVVNLPIDEPPMLHLF